MRAIILSLPMLLCSTPLYAQAAPVIPPAAADRAANTLDAITDAVLDLHIGKLKAAIDGRPATAADRNMTLRDLQARKDPDFDRKLHQQIAQARPMIRQGIERVNDAVPEVLDDLQHVSRAVERATANLPDPTYPVR